MKKNLFFILLFGASSSFFAQQNVSISDVPAIPNPTSVLDVSSTTKGMLMPRMTTAQRNGIVGPANGLLLYDTDVNCVMYYSTTLTSWNSLCAGSSASSLIANTTTVAAGANCPSGGVLLQLGNDGNSNGILDATEITSSQYICNGQAGAIGPAGAAGAAGPQGPVGAAGPQGLAGTNGINCWDLNGNGTNDPTEDVNGDGLFNSTDCSVGIVGPQGPAGAAGAQGSAGAVGATGPQGPAGTNGSAIFYKSTGTTDITINSITWTAMAGMSLTYTPAKTTGYVMVTVAGYRFTNLIPTYVGIRVRVNGTVIKGTSTTCGDLYSDGFSDLVVTPWSASIAIPITTSIGVSTTVDVQWMRDTADGTNVQVLCNPVSQPNLNHRTLIVME